MQFLIKTNHSISSHLVLKGLHPSRGAVNLDADIWLELDPGFKQYEFLQGLDTAAISGLDADQLAQEIIDSGIVNETEGWVTGFDSTVLQQAQERIRQSLDVYLTSNLTNPTVGDVTGGRRTIVREYPTLPSTLPNRVVISGTRYDQLPASLQQSVTWGLGKDLFGQPQNPVTLPFARVNSEKVTLSFRPATDADQQTLESLLPEGDISDLSQIPNSIPSYLISVIPELKLNGEIIGRGSPIKLGQEVDLVTQVKLVGRPVNIRSYSVIAGSYLAVNAYAQTVSSQIQETLQTRLDETRARLESNDSVQLQTLTREHLLGDIFYAGGLFYYTQLLGLSRIMGLESGNHYGLNAGMGTVGYEPNVDTFFGIPRAITPGGVAFDIPIISTSASNDGDRESTRQFTLQTGILSSALEHSTPERMFAPRNIGDPQPDAISAIKALQKASAAGQRIYQITRDTMVTILPSINHDADTMSEIRAALNADKLVITHTHAVSVPGWTGSGYLILDQETGAGAYKISGGSNGGWLLIAAFIFIGLVILIAAFTGNFLLAGLALFQFVVLSAKIQKLSEEIEDPEVLREEVNKAIFISVMAVSTSLLGPFFAAAGAEGRALQVYLAGILMTFGLTQL